MLRNSALVLLIAVATLALNVYLYIIVPKGFFPEQDTGRISGSFLGDQDMSFQAMEGKITQLSAIVQADPAVATVQAFSGGGAGTSANTGRAFIALKPLSERKSSAQQIIDRLRPKLGVVPGVQLSCRPCRMCGSEAESPRLNINTRCRATMWRSRTGPR